eukprot:m.847773 g.847773  ORF g.847773 m.847773 type:complete len:169 (-) comp23486_c0_seq5:1706-2212(-)
MAIPRLVAAYELGNIRSAFNASHCRCSPRPPALPASAHCCSDGDTGLVVQDLTKRRDTRVSSMHLSWITLHTIHAVAGVVQYNTSHTHRSQNLRIQVFSAPFLCIRVRDDRQPGADANIATMHFAMVVTLRARSRPRRLCGATVNSALNLTMECDEVELGACRAQQYG